MNTVAQTSKMQVVIDLPEQLEPNYVKEALAAVLYYNGTLSEKVTVHFALLLSWQLCRLLNRFSCHVFFRLDMMGRARSHLTPKWIIQQTIQWHHFGFSNDPLNRSFPTLTLNRE